jgi:hypothetical protein
MLAVMIFRLCTVAVHNGTDNTLTCTDDLTRLTNALEERVKHNVFSSRHETKKMHIQCMQTDNTLTFTDDLTRLTNAHK